jgi:hypothetical protein
VSGSWPGPARRCPSRLQTRMRSRVSSARERLAELGQDRGDALAVADGDDHERDVGVATEEPGAMANAVGGAVHAEQDGGASDAMAVKQVDDGLVGGP